MESDYCVSCGAYVPEGRHICTDCENGCKQLAVQAYEKSAKECLDDMRADSERFFRAAETLITMLKEKENV
jgi:hypothetical protein